MLKEKVVIAFYFFSPKLLYFNITKKILSPWTSLYMKGNAYD